MACSRCPARTPRVMRDRSPTVATGADRIAYAEFEAPSDASFEETVAIGDDIRAAMPEVEGLRIELGGAAFAEFEVPSSEALGLGFAIVILIIAFGSVLAMGLPIGVALAGIVTGFDDRRPALQRRRHARLHVDDRGHDRPRRGHRLRPVHRHPVPGEPARRSHRRAVDADRDEHGRTSRRLRRHHGGHLAARHADHAARASSRGWRSAWPSSSP